MADRIIDRAAVDAADSSLYCAEVAIEMLGEAAVFSYNDARDAGQAQDRIQVLLASIRGNVKDARAILVREVGGDQGETRQ